MMGCMSVPSGECRGVSFGEVQLRKSFAVTIVVLSAVLAGCQTDDMLTSLRLRPQAQFVLRTARGKALPVIEFSDETRTMQIVADTITLRNDGGGIRKTHFLRRQGVPAVDSLFSVVTPLAYRLDGEKINVELGCGAMICPAVYNVSFVSGEVTRGGLRFDRCGGAGAGNLIPLVYDKQS